ncbi:unnamed protein product [Vitrella brassicaformis CCMP3155]|uniref:Potassium channel tetramerisation-type BTB domain-containing protein n=1 Tax=Vitrella brassicaformis (strain CCMP3155) TaxID=1169540 RepID=A0A0G4EH53_VITBC|nr:unnamed protein product [Vitrella brassicaformis CCMP3155]|eukprot:CEL94699.1 unnamed protein product [Vitrella brassicaformis CCMP3155]
MQLDTRVRLAIEGLQAQREEIAALHETNKVLLDAADLSNEILQLNVGGCHSSVKRKHMTSVEGTLLAALFSGRWDQRLIRDGSSRIFLDVCPHAFEAIRDAIYAGGKEAVEHMRDQAAERDHMGIHDFYVRLLLSPLHKGAADESSKGRDGEVCGPEAEHELLGGFLSTVRDFVRAFEHEQAEIDRQLGAAKVEIESVGPFVKPLHGEEPICSLDVNGKSISTLRSTTEEMGNSALGRRNDASVWSSPVEGVSEDHIRRLIDFYRRKRLAANSTDPQLLGSVGVPLLMDTRTEQRFFEKTCAMYGCEVAADVFRTQQSSFLRSPMGVRYRVIQQGTGPRPRTHHRVEFNHTSWKDGFEGQHVLQHQTNIVHAFPGMYEWAAEAVLSMRAGEVRRLIVPEELWSPSSSFAKGKAYAEIQLLRVVSD